MMSASRIASPARVIVVDPSVVWREVIAQHLAVDPEIKVIAKVATAEAAQRELDRAPADVVVQDLSPAAAVRVIPAAALQSETSVKVVQVAKPATPLAAAEPFRRELAEAVKAAGRARRPTGALAAARFAGAVRPTVVLIGGSTGAPPALLSLVAALTGVTQPILITQHMPATFTAMLADQLGRASGRPSAEAVDGEPILPGRIYVAPGGWHMTVGLAGETPVIRLNQEPPEHFCRPAVDPMLRTAAEVYGAGALAVILTGMGSDGAEGCRAVAEAGGRFIAQDEATSVVWGMPGAAARTGRASAILPLPQIAPWIVTAAAAKPGSDDQTEFFRKLVLERTGVVVADDKTYLLRSRLDPVARAEGFTGVAELLGQVQADPNGRVAQRCLDAIVTHESFFFRDGKPFDQLRDHLLPSLVAGRPANRTLRIWSAACAGGQEPYSLAMLLLEEQAKMPGCRVEIIATDVSEPILERARRGIYSDFEVNRGLSPERRARWLTRHGQAWQINPELRQMVQFRHHNLLDGVGGLGRFDLIFCRNVLIYFDPQRKGRVLNHLAQALDKDGALVLGSAETVFGLDSPFQPHATLRGVFQAPALMRRLG